MLRCNHPAFNDLCNPFYRYYKKVLNPSIKLKYPSEKKIFIENENILLIFCKTLYSSQGEGFPTPI